MAARINVRWQWLFVALAVLAGVGSVTACQYCRMGGDPKACLDLMRTDRSGELRLDAAIGRFQAPAPAAPLTIVTSAAELPVRSARRPSVTAAKPVDPIQAHVLDGGLVGMAVAGGIFFWRTRSPERQ